MSSSPLSPFLTLHSSLTPCDSLHGKGSLGHNNLKRKMNWLRSHLPHIKPLLSQLYPSLSRLTHRIISSYSHATCCMERGHRVTSLWKRGLITLWKLYHPCTWKANMALPAILHTRIIIIARIWAKRHQEGIYYLVAVVFTNVVLAVAAMVTRGAATMRIYARDKGWIFWWLCDNKIASLPYSETVFLHLYFLLPTIKMPSKGECHNTL